MDGFAFDIEMLYIARQLGLVIEQIAVEWYNDERTRVRALRDAFRTLREVFVIRHHHRRHTIQL